MSIQERLHEVLENLPAERWPEVLSFVEYLLWQEDRGDWQAFGKQQLARAYGPAEPEYSKADLKANLHP